jgi:hypothetical protein
MRIASVNNSKLLGEPTDFQRLSIRNEESQWPFRLADTMATNVNNKIIFIFILEKQKQKLLT